MKRPKDSPFGALASLRGKVRESGPLARPAAPVPPPPAEADDLEAFRSAVGDTAPLVPDNRARIERPKPAPTPRPKVCEAEPEAPARRRPADPNDPAALFMGAMAGVEAIRDDGRAEVGKRPKRTAVLGAATAGTDREATPATLTLPTLPIDENDPAALFRHVVGSAEPLPDRNLATLKRQAPPPIPIQQQKDEAEALRESIEAPLSFEDRLDIGDEGVYLRDGIPRRVLADLRRGRWVIQGEIDLHGHTRDEARAELSAFLVMALEQGWRCIRVIHGKGLGSPGREGVLKYLSRGWLMQRQDILAFCQARPHDGGEGALLVLLRNRNKGPAAGD